jgi:hypothetical protein
LGFHPVAVVLTLVHTIQMENYKTVHTVSTSTHIEHQTVYLFEYGHRHCVMQVHSYV